MRLFEWDPAKAASNLRKHGVSFEFATRVFADPNAFSEQDRVEGGEERWQTLGLVQGGPYQRGVLLLLVAHTVYEDDRDGGVIEVIRMISARAADRKERKRYEREARDAGF